VRNARGGTPSRRRKNESSPVGAARILFYLGEWAQAYCSRLHIGATGIALLILHVDTAVADVVSGILSDLAARIDVLVGVDPIQHNIKRRVNAFDSAREHLAEAIDISGHDRRVPNRLPAAPSPGGLSMEAVSG
jgi:hypothetical protein